MQQKYDCMKTIKLIALGRPHARAHTNLCIQTRTFVNTQGKQDGDDGELTIKFSKSRGRQRKREIYSIDWSHFSYSASLCTLHTHHSSRLLYTANRINRSNTVRRRELRWRGTFLHSLPLSFLLFCCLSSSLLLSIKSTYIQTPTHTPQTTDTYTYIHTHRTRARARTLAHTYTHAYWFVVLPPFEILCCLLGKWWASTVKTRRRSKRPCEDGDGPEVGRLLPDDTGRHWALDCSQNY